MFSWDAIRRTVLDHRRLLAAVCAGLAVLAALGSVRDSRDGPRVLVAAHDLASGTVVDAGDVRTTRLVPGHRIAGVIKSPTAVVGHRIAGPMRRGEPLTDRRVLASGPADDRPAGTVTTTIRLGGADALGPARVGDVVDVVAVPPGDGVDEDGSPARVVARAVEVLAIREAKESSGSDAPIALDVATPRASALDLAAAGLRSRLTVLVSTPPAPGR